MSVFNYSGGKSIGFDRLILALGGDFECFNCLMIHTCSDYHANPHRGKQMMRSLTIPGLENYPETLVVNTTVVDSQMYFIDWDSSFILSQCVYTINQSSGEGVQNTVKHL